MSSKFLTLVNLTPIGYSYPNYPVKHCALCKGLLIEPCVDCETKMSAVKNSKNCEVIDDKEVWYHKHCHMNINNKTEK